MEPRLLEWCRALISCPSVTSAGTEAIARLCAERILAPCGIKARLLAATSGHPDDVILIANIDGAEPDLAPIVFNTHLDTVAPGDPALWTACEGDPFNPRIVGDRIHGLGSADTKLDFAAKADALAACPRPRRNVMLIGSFGEERGLVGAKEIAGRGLLPAGGLAYIGEACGLRIVTATKGLSAYALIVRFEPQPARAKLAVSRAIFAGKSAHSSTPQLGRNAIEEALAYAHDNPECRLASISGGDALNKVPARCEILLEDGAALRRSPAAALEPLAKRQPRSWLPAAALEAVFRFAQRLHAETRSEIDSDPDYPAPALTCNLAMVHSTSSEIVVDFELRPPPSLAARKVGERVATITAELAPQFPELQIELKEIRTSPAFRTRADSETVALAAAALKRAGLEVQRDTKMGATEAGVFQAAGLSPIVFGPGPPRGVIHAPNEYNLLSQVEAATRFYRMLLEL